MASVTFLSGGTIAASGQTTFSFNTAVYTGQAYKRYLLACASVVYSGGAQVNATATFDGVSGVSVAQQVNGTGSGQYIFYDEIPADDTQTQFVLTLASNGVRCVVSFYILEDIDVENIIHAKLTNSGTNAISTSVVTSSDGFVVGYATQRLTSAGNASWTNLTKSEQRGATTLNSLCGLGTAIGSTWSDTATFSSNGGNSLTLMFLPVLSAGSTGQIKVWNGTNNIAKPIKYWNGTSWAIKPLKRWNGTSWLTTNY